MELTPILKSENGIDKKIDHFSDLDYEVSRRKIIEGLKAMNYGRQ